MTGLRIRGRPGSARVCRLIAVSLVVGLLSSGCSEAPTYNAEEIAGIYRLSHYRDQPLPYVLRGEPNDSVVLIGGDLVLASDGGANAGDSLYVVSVDTSGAKQIRVVRAGTPGSFTVHGNSIELHVELQTNFSVRRAGPIAGRTITLTQYPVFPEYPERTQTWRYVRD